MTFTADQDRAAAGLPRVCRPGAQIGLANRTPGGFIGALFKTSGRHVPPPAGVRSPMLWGTEARRHGLSAKDAASIERRARDFVFRYRSPAHFLDVFRTWYGPLLKAFGTLDASGQTAFDKELKASIGRFNRSADQTLVAPGGYLQIVIARR